jgi:hypothetical protein
VENGIAGKIQHSTASSVTDHIQHKHQHVADEDIQHQIGDPEPGMPVTESVNGIGQSSQRTFLPHLVQISHELLYPSSVGKSTEKV